MLQFVLSIAWSRGGVFGQRQGLSGGLHDAAHQTDDICGLSAPSIATAKEAWAEVDAADWGADDNATQIALELARMGPERAIDALFSADPFGVYNVAAFR